MNYYSGIHISARPSNFNLRKCVELTPATRKKWKETFQLLYALFIK